MLQLARENRWTNFVFNPIDVIQDHARLWEGIDYLGENWPPQWYPTRPSAGKTLDQWIARLKTAKGKVLWTVERAIEDLGTDALPALEELVNDSEPLYQLRTSRLVLEIGRRAALPAALSSRAAEIAEASR